jgi:hypothetical protein
MTWRITFSSARFLPTLPEACQVNPGCYGFELALWLAQSLGREGCVTGYPCEEDWGWCLAYQPCERVSLTIGCSSTCEAGAGYRDQPVGWSVFIREQRSLEQRIRNHSDGAALERLGRRILALLRAERIDVAAPSASETNRENGNSAYHLVTKPCPPAHTRPR